jgi:hypothetical protein
MPENESVQRLLLFPLAVSVLIWERAAASIHESSSAPCQIQQFLSPRDGHMRELFADIESNGAGSADDQ